jgi:hypothetical protein
MPGITLDDIAKDGEIEAAAAAAEAIENIEQGEYDQDVVNQNRRNEILKKLLTTETGPGPLSDYIDHPMNFNKSKGLAKILRGISGFLGGNSLKLAIIDIVIGALEFSKERVNIGSSSGNNTNY